MSTKFQTAFNSIDFPISNAGSSTRVKHRYVESKLQADKSKIKKQVTYRENLIKNDLLASVEKAKE